MKFTPLVAFVGLLVLASVTPVWAWGPAGHKIVASIAFRQLTEAEQVKIIRLLEEHPRYDEDFSTKMPQTIANGAEANQHEWLFQQSAIWPDMARDFHGDDLREYHRAEWHYINKPIFLTADDRTALESQIHLNLVLNPPTTELREMNVIQVIRYARSVLRDNTADSEEKALMLAWLMHTVGDIHQPLHSTALFSRRLFPNGDRGGTRISTVQRRNLHGVWDRFPGGNANFNAVSQRAQLLLDAADLAMARTNAASTLGEETWLDESFELASTVAYGTEVSNNLKQMETMQIDIDEHPMRLSEDYLREGGKIASRRVVEAGVRLGKILKEIAAN